ncbi:DNA adenine methylase [Megasphaera elsdenii]|uniref:DNA adenine methylase n=1 Tax=Megasphaera elsdenii TaxID=907 RepID=UPI00265E939C|nr:DNA adenine methylase [Megasphaera elsdenii]
MTEFKMSPFVKWAGGKSQLLDTLIAKLPVQYGRYYEPFIGGGAFLLGLSPKKAAINDTNSVLINIYRQLKENENEVIERLRNLDSVLCDKERYYQLRKKYNEKIMQGCTLDTEVAALMIWLNKHCFNGLYRVNKKGLFNVPWNRREKGNSFDESNLQAIGKYLRDNDILIRNEDFEIFCNQVQAGDFVYFDSPYIPVTETANFTDYTADGFTLADHQRLAKLFDVLNDRGVFIMLSNNDTPLVYELYGNKGYKIQSIDVKRLINRNAKKRTGKEVIITNY